MEKYSREFNKGIISKVFMITIFLFTGCSNYVDSEAESTPKQKIKYQINVINRHYKSASLIFDSLNSDFESGRFNTKEEGLKHYGESLSFHRQMILCHNDSIWRIIDEFNVPSVVYDSLFLFVDDTNFIVKINTFNSKIDEVN